MWICANCENENVDTDTACSKCKLGKRYTVLKKINDKNVRFVFKYWFLIILFVIALITALNTIQINNPAISIFIGLITIVTGTWFAINQIRVSTEILKQPMQKQVLSINNFPISSNTHINSCFMLGIAISTIVGIIWL